MKVTLLGTGSPIPHPFRAGPATLVQAGTDSVLVDAGRGVIMRLAQAGLVPTMLSGVGTRPDWFPRCSVVWSSPTCTVITCAI